MHRKLNKPIRHAVVFYAVYFLITLFRLLPRKAAITIARLMGLLFYFCAVRYRRNTIRHLTLAFGNEKSKAVIHRLSRQVFLHFATVGVDAIRIPLYIRSGMDDLVTVSNRHYLEQVRAQKTGFIVLTGHFGNWELLGAWLGRQKINLHVVGAPLANPRINKLIVDVRNAAGYINIERGNATRGIITALTKGFPVALLIDQDIKGKGVYVDFFGMKAHTPVGPAALAGKFSVPVLPMVMRLRQDLTYELVFFPPLYYHDTGDREKDTLELTQRCTDVYEGVIRQHPEQWGWMHRRWKRQPGHESKKKREISDDKQG